MTQKVLDWWLEMPPSGDEGDELVFDDGEPTDSPEHRENATLLVDTMRKFFEGRDDIYVGANEALYFSSIQARNRDFRAPDVPTGESLPAAETPVGTSSYRSSAPARYAAGLRQDDLPFGPDFFIVLGCDGKAYRKGWVVWNEGGKVPDLIIELLSPTTESADRTVKFDTYRRLNVREYILFDVLTDALEGYVLNGQDYLPMPRDAQGHMECLSLDLKLGLWQGEFHGYERQWLRFFHPDGRVVPTFAEAEAQRAEAEAQRANAAAAENAALLARLAAYEARFGSLAPGSNDT